jgi:hypothetical protein
VTPTLDGHISLCACGRITFGTWQLAVGNPHLDYLRVVSNSRPDHRRTCIYRAKASREKVPGPVA